MKVIITITLSCSSNNRTISLVIISSSYLFLLRPSSSFLSLICKASLYNKHNENQLTSSTYLVRRLGDPWSWNWCWSWSWSWSWSATQEVIVVFLPCVFLLNFLCLLSFLLFVFLFVLKLIHFFLYDSHVCEQFLTVLALKALLLRYN